MIQLRNTLVALSPRNRPGEREAAAKDLLTLIRRVFLPSAARRSGSPRMPAVDADELVSRVALKLLDVFGADSPRATLLDDMNNGQCYGYVLKTVVNALYDFNRERADARRLSPEERPHEVDFEGPDPASVIPDAVDPFDDDWSPTLPARLRGVPVDIDSLRGDATRLLNLVLERTLRGLSKEARLRSRTIWEELVGLKIGTFSEADIRERYAGRPSVGSSEPERRKRAAQRYAQAHKQFRNRLLKSVEQLEDEQIVGEREAAKMIRLLARWLPRKDHAAGVEKERLFVHLEQVLAMALRSSNVGARDTLQASFDDLRALSRADMTPTDLAQKYEGHFHARFQRLREVLLTSIEKFEAKGTLDSRQAEELRMFVNEVTPAHPGKDQIR